MFKSINENFNNFSSSLLSIPYSSPYQSYLGQDIHEKIFAVTCYKISDIQPGYGDVVSLYIRKSH